jgi:hypothetical protein
MFNERIIQMTAYVDYERVACWLKERLDEVLNRYVGFYVLTAASVKMAVVWADAPTSLLELYRRFRGASCLSSGRESLLWWWV